METPFDLRGACAFFSFVIVATAAQWNVVLHESHHLAACAVNSQHAVQCCEDYKQRSLAIVYMRNSLRFNGCWRICHDIVTASSCRMTLTVEFSAFASVAAAVTHMDVIAYWCGAKLKCSGLFTVSHHKSAAWLAYTHPPPSLHVCVYLYSYGRWDCVVANYSGTSNWPLSFCALRMTGSGQTKGL